MLQLALASDCTICITTTIEVTFILRKHTAFSVCLRLTRSTPSEIVSREITQTDVGRTEFVYGPPEYNHATHPTRTGATFQSEICCAMGIHHTCAVFSGRTFYFLVTEGSNPMATSVMLMWLCLFMMFRLKSSVNGQLSTS